MPVEFRSRISDVIFFGGSTDFRLSAFGDATGADFVCSGATDDVDRFGLEELAFLGVAFEALTGATVAGSVFGSGKFATFSFVGFFDFVAEGGAVIALSGLDATFADVDSPDKVRRSPMDPPANKNTPNKITAPTPAITRRTGSDIRVAASLL